MGDWCFLDEWFRALKGAVSIFNPSPHFLDHKTVRLGYDSDGDTLWINVRIVPEEANDETQRAAHCRVLHEALVLTSILAVADYDAWRNALASTSELSVSPAVDPDLTPRRLQPRYRVEVAKSSWANIQQIIASDHRSDRFQEHYAMAMETAEGLGVRLDATTQFPVCVFACPDKEWPRPPTERQLEVAWMRSMITTVVALESANDGQSDDAQISLRLGRLDAPKLGDPQRRVARDSCGDRDGRAHHVPWSPHELSRR